ncbi:MAG: hypothetical protein N2047_04005 [Meiothermus sp.]|nr:hypothetical protein [Meiothermus sp.]GIW31427.1 MAG: hypothetical protein KatS3mg071_1601 [Meiothermus sp.]
MYKASTLQAIWKKAKAGDHTELEQLETRARGETAPGIWGLALVCMAGQDFERAARTLNENRAIWTLKDEMDWQREMRRNMAEARERRWG